MDPNIPETNLVFPCDFDVKAIGNSEYDLKSLVSPIMKKYVEHFSLDNITEQYSRNKKYLSLTISFTALSKKQLDDIYTEINALPETIMTL